MNAQAGKSQPRKMTVSARYHGIHKSSVSIYAKRHGLKFADGRKTPEHAARMSNRIREFHAARIAHLSEADRELYQTLRGKGYSSDFALSCFTKKAAK
jgi:hypothetical protein